MFECAKWRTFVLYHLPYNFEIIDVLSESLIIRNNGRYFQLTGKLERTELKIEQSRQSCYSISLQDPKRTFTYCGELYYFCYDEEMDIIYIFNEDSNVRHQVTRFFMNGEIHGIFEDLSGQLHVVGITRLETDNDVWMLWLYE